MNPMKTFKNLAMETYNGRIKKRKISKRTIKKGRTHKLRIYKNLKLKRRFIELFGEDIKVPELSDDILNYINELIKCTVGDKSNESPQVIKVQEKHIYDFPIELYTKITQEITDNIKDMALILNFQLIEFQWREKSLAHCEKQKEILNSMGMYNVEKERARRKFAEQRKDRGSKFVNLFLNSINALGGEKALMPIFSGVMKEESKLSQNNLYKSHYIKKCRRLVYGMLKDNDCIFHRYEYFFRKMKGSTFKKLMRKALNYNYARAVLSPTCEPEFPEPGWNFKEPSSSADNRPEGWT